MTRLNTGYLPQDSIYPHKGLNTLDPSTIIDPRFSPFMKNVEATDGIVQSRTGYIQLGDNLGGSPVMELIEWSTENGARQLIAVTTEYQFKFDATSETWTNISQDDGADTAVVSFVVGEQTIYVSGDVSANWSAGDYVRVNGSTNAGTYRVVSATYSNPNTDIVVEGGITSGAAVTDETIDKVIAMTGTVDNPYDYVVATDDTDTYLFLTNGVDDVLWYSGSGTFTDYKPADINSGNGFTAYTVGLLNNHLIFGNYETGGEKYFIWSNNGNFQTADGFTAGVNDTSGSIFLSDADGAILKLKRLGDRMAIYTENSIHLISYVGGDLIFSVEKVVEQTRFLSPRAIADLGPFHFYVSQENFYLFDGTRLLRTIGDVVQQDYRDHVNLDLANQAFAFHNTPVNEVYFVIPTSTSEVESTRTYVIEYDLFRVDNTRWSTQVYTDRLLSMGYFTRGDETSGGTGLTWGSSSIATKTWGSIDQTVPWNTGTIREGYPVLIFGDSLGNVHETGTSQQDNGSNFESTWHSIDFTVPQAYETEFGRWLDLELELRGSNVAIDVSVDMGYEWTNVTASQDLTGKWARYRFPIDVFGRTCRVKVTTTGGGFQLKWLRLWVRPGGAR